MHIPIACGLAVFYNIKRSPSRKSETYKLFFYSNNLEHILLYIYYLCCMEIRLKTSYFKKFLLLVKILHNSSAYYFFYSWPVPRSSTYITNANVLYRRKDGVVFIGIFCITKVFRTDVRLWMNVFCDKWFDSVANRSQMNVFVLKKLY